MKVIYTYTDEAPALATHSLLPIIRAFAGQAGVEVELRDMSIAGRILAQFGQLGERAKPPEANIIKPPNISTSSPLLKASIKERQYAVYSIPAYDDDPE